MALRTGVRFSQDGTATQDSVGTSAIVDGTVANADINDDAAIALSKLAGDTALAVAQFGADGKLEALTSGSNGTVLASQGPGQPLTWAANGGGGVPNDGSVTGPKLATEVYKAGLLGIGVADDGMRVAYENDNETVFYDVNDKKRLSINATEVQVFDTTETEAMSVTDNGVEIRGDLVVTGSVTGSNWNGSERAWKKRLQRVVGAMDKLARLNGYTWVYNELSVWDGQRSAGVVVDEIVKVFPEAVQYSARLGGCAVNMNFVHAVVIEAMKELNDRVATLERQGQGQAVLNEEMRARHEGLVSANAALRQRVERAQCRAEHLQMRVDHLEKRHLDMEQLAVANSERVAELQGVVMQLFASKPSPQVVPLPQLPVQTANLVEGW